jgi:hypothetical protein
MAFDRIHICVQNSAMGNTLVMIYNDNYLYTNYLHAL